MFRKLPFGAAGGIYPFARDSNDPKTQVEALNVRLCRKLPPIDPVLLAEFREFVRQWLSANLTPIPAGGLLTFDEWLESTTYPGRRKEELRAVYERLHGRLPNRKVARRINAFIKSESYLIGSVFKAARWICSRCDEAKVAMGPAFKTIERAVYANHHFIKHVPVRDRARLISSLEKAGLSYIITDYTAFEASFHEDFMAACEVQLYQYMLSSYPELSAFITATLTGTNEIRTRLGTRVSVKGRRMSGDMCTSLGNGFTNLMLMSFFCSRLGSTFDGYVEGDDGVFAVSGDIPTPADFARLGFEIKLAKVDSPSLGGFCGIVSAGDTLIRDPVRFLQTFGWTTTCVEGGPKVMMQLLRAKALSALYEAPACPLVSAIAARALELTSGVEPRFELDGYHEPPPAFVPEVGAISADTRYLFETLFGVSATLQCDIEARVANANDLDFLGDLLPYNPLNKSGVHPNHGLVGAWFAGP